MAATFRRIRPADDASVAALIRQVMPEFGAVGTGYAIEDAEVDAMSVAYAQPRSAYWVLESESGIVGGGGYAQLVGAESDTAELRKMYFVPEARGRGLGQGLLELCLSGARTDGYARLYLETLGNMHAAVRLYERFGFRSLEAPLGATGHHGCNRWMALDL